MVKLYDELVVMLIICFRERLNCKTLNVAAARMALSPFVQDGPV